VLLLAWALLAQALLLLVLLRVLGQQQLVLELPWPWVLPAPPEASNHTRRTLEWQSVAGHNLP
jgi:hypothetical protein